MTAAQRAVTINNYEVIYGRALSYFSQMDKKVLIIDDDPDIAEAVKIVLESRGFTIKTASSFGGNKVIEEFRPGLILLDFLLAGENGGEIAKVIKKNPNIKNIPIILLSAQPPSLLRQISKECGADGFLQKPFDISDLITLVKSNFSGSKNPSFVRR